MPLVYLSLRKGSSTEYKNKIAVSIHKAMKEVLNVPEDDYNQVTFDQEPEDMMFNPRYFGIERSAKTVFIQMFFNTRPPEVKAALYTAIANNLVESPGLRKEDIGIIVVETAPENWWAYGREVNPSSGFDKRMNLNTTTSS